MGLLKIQPGQSEADAVKAYASVMNGIGYLAIPLKVDFNTAARWIRANPNVPYPAAWLDTTVESFNYGLSLIGPSTMPDGASVTGTPGNLYRESRQRVRLLPADATHPTPWTASGSQVGGLFVY